MQPMTPEDLARFFHETYERLAPEHGYKTREASSVPWADVPERNKSLMIAVAERVGAEHEQQVRAAMGKQLVERFQAMREDGEQDMRTVIAFVRDAMRGEV